MLTMRGHHIWCTMLFEGKGYDSGFTSSMGSVVGQLRGDLSQGVRIIADYDDICSRCPNRCDKSPDLCENRRVAEKDREIIKLLGLSEGEEYSYNRLISLVKEKVTEEIFTSSCGNCLWYTSGVCSYDKLVRAGERGNR
ncbi:MAG: DUF1284 domain-containing protein [Oscillospiraceae bacterium]|nr:DUF1284 domain-containing protein [Oscillospiraceae bacterium]